MVVNSAERFVCSDERISLLVLLLLSHRGLGIVDLALSTLEI